METLRLDVVHKPVEDIGEEPPSGFVRVEQGRGSGVLLTPDEIDPDRQYPLITVLHGAGRQDELLVKACRHEPNRRDAFFFVPRSIEQTWDLIAGSEPHDLRFLEYAYDLIYRRYPIDPGAQCMIGYSDGASYGLSLGLTNGPMFDALMVWAAGFVVVDRNHYDPAAAKPRLYLEYGTHDQLFDFEQVALPMKENLEKAGYDLTFSIDEGGRHMPSGDFQREALDWYFDGPPATG